MKITVYLDVEQLTANQLVTMAVVRGFLREHPERAWTFKEYRSAIRFAIQNIVNDIPRRI